MKRKSIELSLLVIERIIVHDIPKHKKNDTSVTPSYSEQECEASDAMRRIFKDKIIAALDGEISFKICFDENKDSPVPLYVKEIMQSQNDVFISHTKKIADRLLSSQDGVNAAGILLIIDGKINEDKVCIIMKLERDKGVQLKLNPVTKSFDLHDVDDLMLTQKTKLYKVALFVQREDFKTKFDGILTDYQINMKAKKEICTYFMDNFLGCKPYQDPKFSTQKFYNLTKTYIDTIEDEITRTKYIQDLNSYIQKNQNTISPKQFAEDYFGESEHKDTYKNYLREKDIAYDSAIVKDTTLIENKIKRITISFENDISIVGNKGVIDKKVSFERLENGQHKAEIVSKIKSIV